MKKLITLLLAIITSALVNQADADIVTGLYNTGVDNSGAQLPDFAVDPHWTLTTVPAGSGLGPDAYAGDPLPGFWVTNSPDARWIGPNKAIDEPAAIGGYEYTQTFDLTGFDSSTAVITGAWAADNVSGILVNGLNTGIGHSGGTAAYSFFDTFVLDSSNSVFNPGINQLTFRVGNIDGPTGLQVSELRGNANLAVPEPATAGLAGGLLLVGLLRRRRTRARQVDRIDTQQK